MKKLHFIFICMILIWCVSSLSPRMSSAGVNLPWSTTYNCADWDQSMGLLTSDVNCDGLSGNGAWIPPGGELEQITAAANNPNGGGGKGQRHWIGDGVNVNSGSMSLSFNTPQPEFWFRWYTRFQSGFAWNPLQAIKLLYFDNGTNYSVYLGFMANTMYFHPNPLAGNIQSNDGTGWYHIMNGPTSDGLFHCHEIHMKMDTNGSNGIAEYWVDGVQVISVNNVNYGTASGWNGVIISSNAKTPANGRDMYQDVDDIKIQTTGYIGPIPGTVPPASPVSLQVK